jgi:hypothetical protein
MALVVHREQIRIEALDEPFEEFAIREHAF